MYTSIYTKHMCARGCVSMGGDVISPTPEATPTLCLCCTNSPAGLVASNSSHWTTTLLHSLATVLLGSFYFLLQLLGKPVVALYVFSHFSNFPYNGCQRKVPEPELRAITQVIEDQVQARQDLKPPKVSLAFSPHRDNTPVTRSSHFPSTL